MDFSVLMSVYDREVPEYLDQCFESMKVQTLKAAEIILVVDGPLNSSLLGVIEKWESCLPIKKLLLDRNVGLGKALSLGIQQCSNELVLRMDTDDICREDRFEKQVRYMESHPELMILGSNVMEFDPKSGGDMGPRSVPSADSDIRRWMKYRNPFNHMSVAYKKSAVMNAGGYLHLKYMEDYYLWLRMMSEGYSGANLEDCLVRARTGIDMLTRRRGVEYVKSELELFRIKLNLGITGRVEGFFIFAVRALIRMLPIVGVGFLYKVVRRLSLMRRGQTVG